MGPVLVLPFRREDGLSLPTRGWGLYWSFRSVNIASVQTQDVVFFLLSWHASMHCFHGVPSCIVYQMMYPFVFVSRRLVPGESPAGWRRLAQVGAGWRSGEWRAGKPSSMGMFDTLGCWTGCCLLSVEGLFLRGLLCCLVAVCCLVAWLLVALLLCRLLCCLCVCFVCLCRVVAWFLPCFALCSAVL